MRYDEKRQDGMRWDETLWDGMRWDGMGWDWRWDELRWDEIIWDKMRWDETGWLCSLIPSAISVWVGGEAGAGSCASQRRPPKTLVVRERRRRLESPVGERQRRGGYLCRSSDRGQRSGAGEAPIGGSGREVWGCKGGGMRCWCKSHCLTFSLTFDCSISPFVQIVFVSQ